MDGRVGEGKWCRDVGWRRVFIIWWFGRGSYDGVKLLGWVWEFGL